VSDFKGRHFGGEIVLWAVRWYCRYGISYRDLEQMMAERGVSVDHSTIYRWVQRYAPEIEKRLRWHWRRPRSGSWRVDETYVKVRGKWSYLYRAVDKLGNTIDFYLSPTRNTMAAKRFLAKALRGLKDWEQPEVINTDKAPTYAAALAELKAEGKCPKDTQHRQVKYLNNIIEADHGKLKQLIRPVRGATSGAQPSGPATHHAGQCIARSHGRIHVGRRHQLHRMPERSQLTRPMMHRTDGVGHWPTGGVDRYIDKDVKEAGDQKI